MRLPFLFLTLLPVLAQGALLPGSLGKYRQVASAPLPVADAALWNELGLQQAETATYRAAGAEIRVAAWRLADSTSGLAAFDALLPPAATPAGDQQLAVTPLARRLPNGLLAALGNTVVRIEGYVPAADELANFFRSIPRFEQGPLPLLPDYLALQGLRPNTQRYIIGPNALKAFLPQVSPASAGFSMGAEATVAEYEGGQKLAIFSYPTPAIARDRLPQFQSIPGLLAKRTGSLVVAVVSRGNTNDDERLLSQIRYQASVTVGQKPKTPRDNPGNLLLNIVYLCLILAAFCAVSGVVVGGLLYMLRRSGPSGEGDQMISLRLEKR